MTTTLHALGFPMDFLYTFCHLKTIFPLLECRGNSHLANQRIRLAVTFQAFGVMALKKNLHPPNYIHSSQLRVTYVLYKVKDSLLRPPVTPQSTDEVRAAGRGMGSTETFSHSLPLVYAFLWQTPYETGSASD